MFNAIFTRLLTVFFCLLLSHSPAWAEVGEAAGKTLAVLDLAISGDLSDSSKNAEWAQRRSHMSEILREKLQDSGLYVVVGSEQTLRTVEEMGVTQPFHACNGCELDIARRLNAQYVLVGWVSRISNLVLSLNIEIRQVASGRTIFRKGLDFRGDNDQGWARAMEYFVKNLKERD